MGSPPAAPRELTRIVTEAALKPSVIARNDDYRRIQDEGYSVDDETFCNCGNWGMKDKGSFEFFRCGYRSDACVSANAQLYDPGHSRKDVRIPELTIPAALFNALPRA